MTRPDPMGIPFLADDVGEEAAREVVRAYLDELPPALAAIRDAAEALDAERLVAAAHSLKSSSLVIGARSLADACFEVERAAREGDAAVAARSAERVPSEAEAVRAELEASL